ncbi:MAG: urease accessory protein UreD [Gammaproteobacteria bacterium]
MSAQPAPAWHGRLALRFERRDARTVLARSEARMPLALQRPFYPEGDGVCHVVALHPPGGMVGGDRIDIDVALQPGAEALITTPSAAKWYRGLVTAEQCIHARIARSAHLEWLPLETIVFDRAQARQTLRVDLDPDATFLGWEITRFGRSARGETFNQGSWRAITEVWRAGKPLWVDRQRLHGGSSAMQSAYGLAGQPVTATLVFLGRTMEDDMCERARTLWGSGGYPGEAGVTRFNEGMLCRYRGPSSAAVREWFIAVWDAIRRKARDRSAQPPRIWRT